MRAFSELYEELDTTTSTNLKVAAMVRYFNNAAPADAAWAAYILSGRRLKRFIGPALLWRWLVEASALPEWLVEESSAHGRRPGRDRRTAHGKRPGRGRRGP